mmetsp:Transcript_30524/g.65345  ORF Transcript_30524/g.65345 Transcript_30524/m.65345 type:complete len:269 (+) Transcript_30524:469-1275(+)
MLFRMLFLHRRVNPSFKSSLPRSCALTISVRSASLRASFSYSLLFSFMSCSGSSNGSESAAKRFSTSLMAVSSLTRVCKLFRSEGRYILTLLRLSILARSKVITFGVASSAVASLSAKFEALPPVATSTSTRNLGPRLALTFLKLTTEPHTPFSAQHTRSTRLLASASMSSSSHECCSEYSFAPRYFSTSKMSCASTFTSLPGCKKGRITSGSCKSARLSACSCPTLCSTAKESSSFFSFSIRKLERSRSSFTSRLSEGRASSVWYWR